VRQVSGCCEHGDETAGRMNNYGEFLENLSDYSPTCSVTALHGVRESIGLLFGWLVSWLAGYFSLVSLVG
jgi:hypothetical protein